MDEALKFTWAYMIQEGLITNGKWNYYGGNFEIPNQSYDYIQASKDMEKLRAEIKTVGIDWAKTSIPESSHESCFEGTFSDSSTVETLLGTLVLKNGSEYVIGVSNAEVRFQSYIQLLKNLMEDKQRVKDLLGE